MTDYQEKLEHMRDVVKSNFGEEYPDTVHGYEQGFNALMPIVLDLVEAIEDSLDTKPMEREQYLYDWFNTKLGQALKRLEERLGE